MWVLNVFLFLLWEFNPPQYQAAVAAGQPCYAYVSALGNENGPRPTCPYQSGGASAVLQSQKIYEPT